MNIWNRIKKANNVILVVLENSKYTDIKKNQKTNLEDDEKQEDIRKFCK